MYCLSRQECENVASELGAHGIKSLPYHAGLDDSNRFELILLIGSNNIKSLIRYRSPPKSGIKYLQSSNLFILAKLLWSQANFVLAILEQLLETIELLFQHLVTLYSQLCKQNVFTGQFPAPFFFISVFSTVNRKYVH